MNASIMEGSGTSGPDGDAISRPQTPAPGRRVSGIIGRLLERTRSTRSIRSNRSNNQQNNNTAEGDLKRRLFRKSTGSAAELKSYPAPTTTTTASSDVVGNTNTTKATGSTSFNAPVATQHHRRSRSAVTAPVAATTSAGNMTAQAKAAQPHCHPPTPDMAGSMTESSPALQQQQQQQTLKKKTSFRDRLRSWQKGSAALEQVAEEDQQQPQEAPPKPRFVYVPQHAAADFENQMMAPWSPRQEQVRRRTPPYHSPPEANSPSSSSPSFSPPGASHDERRNPFADPENTFFAHQSSSMRPESEAELSPGTRPLDLSERPISPTQPLSDYELFIQQAEAKEREEMRRREWILRGSVGSSSFGHGLRVKPDPHRQFVSIAEDEGGIDDPSRDSFAAAIALRNRFGSIHSHQDYYHHQGRQQSHVESHGKSESDAQGSRRDSNWASPNWTSPAWGGAGYASPPDGSSTSDSVARRTSATPVTTTTSTTAASSGGRRRSAGAAVHGHASHVHGHGPARRPSEPAWGDLSSTSSSRGYSGATTPLDSPPQSPRTVRRKTSLGQKIAEYIKPPMPPRPIETVVE
ncbi:hypothetical protein VTJ04DRAFT_4202 [Mycothermus thermophilus]|uniref:uncharacterized protein n=1 Tax=Humicola insolens TaxID=85995 RepID=UPI0037449C9B